MPDGEFLCPKCKADEAALPPTPSNRSRSNSATVAMPQDRANGQVGKNGGQSMSAAGVPRASGEGAAMGLCNGGLSRAEGQHGVGEEDAGVNIVATDGSPVEVTQIARLERDHFFFVCVYVMGYFLVWSLMAFHESTDEGVGERA